MALNYGENGGSQNLYQKGKPIAQGEFITMDLERSKNNFLKFEDRIKVIMLEVEKFEIQNQEDCERHQQDYGAPVSHRYRPIRALPEKTHQGQTAAGQAHPFHFRGKVCQVGGHKSGADSAG